MRRIAIAVAVLTLVLTSPPTTQAQAPAPSGPPHAWLFGSWIGGIFPPPVTLSAQECLAQPMVVFTRDVVMRAIMTSPSYAERLIGTARATANGFEIQLLPASADPEEPAAVAGFGCPNPNVLPVQRRSDNEITFPGCTDFPFPLIRCGSR
jgi:hypothetical protein